MLKGDGLEFRYVYYNQGQIPALNINPETDVVLALGGDTLQELKDFGLVKKNLTIGSSRGKVYILPCGARCLTSYSYSIRNVDYSLYVEFLGDLQLATRLLSTGSLVPPMLDFAWVPDLTEVLKGIEEKKAEKDIVDTAVDLETTGLIAFSEETWIVTFQISTDEISSRVIKFDKDFQPRKPDFTVDQGTPQCREELIWVQINQILNDPKISLKGANLKYDLGWIAEKWGIFCTNFKHDTLLVGSLLDENRSNSLKTHAFVYTPYGGYEQDLYDKYDIAKPHEVPDKVLLPYCGYDTAVCLRVARVQKEELNEGVNKLLMRFYVKILHPAARAYERVERTGVLIDLKYYLGVPENLEIDVDAEVKKLMYLTPEQDAALLAKEGSEKYQEKRKKALIEAIQEVEIRKFGLKGYLEYKLSTNLKAAHKIIPGHILSRYADNQDLSRAAMISDYLFTSGRGLKLKPVMFTPKPDKKTGLPKPSTALDHFLKFKDHKEAGPFVKVLEDYKDVAKTLSTYMDGFLKHLRYDNRFHASFFLFKGGAGDDDDAGTNTGRISIKDPALQTIPKKTKWAKVLRRGFIAPEGYIFFSADYSQGELRIAADLANEQVMINAYNSGLDLHAVTGAGLADIAVEKFMLYKECGDKIFEEVYDINRQKAKGANFGLLYGMGAEGFQFYAETAYSVIMNITEATEAREKFFETYPRLLPWHEECRTFARQNGYMLSPLGRMRHLPLLNSPDKQVASKELRRAINSPVQGTLSDMSLWATSIMEKEGHTQKAPVCLMVHDQLCAYLPEDNWQFYAKRYQEIMENLPFEQMGWTPKVKFEVELQLSFGDKEKGIPPNLADIKTLKQLGLTL